MIPSPSAIQITCYHCGDTCGNESIQFENKYFCCSGCKQVYLLLSENNLCTYYNLDESPGIKVKGKFAGKKFAYLDDEKIHSSLVKFSSASCTNVTFSLPQMHCSSCVFLLENLHKINEGIITSQVNFQRKEIFISFNTKQISLRKVVELLAFIGYEPEITLKDSISKKANTFNKQQIYKIGVAGFCFANIMMLSFPEYFSSGYIEQSGLKQTFIWLNFSLSLPVLFFSAAGFFTSAIKGIRQKIINIDAPIALAISVTYFRSYYEIISGNGAGYLDSGTGIVFFMLIGRWFQDKTYDSFSFDRDYQSYFPLGVSVVKDGAEKNIPVTQLKKGSKIIIRNEEMIPADAILIKGAANINYSFVSGEDAPVKQSIGKLLYAGGKQIGTAIELEVIAEVSQSYITQLWNNNVFLNKKNQVKSFVHPWSSYFTIALFSIAIITLLYWWINDTSKILPAVSSVLIVACPCSLLLSATFAYGNMLRIFGKNKFFLKNASVIESLAKIDTIIFDKTGTLTLNNSSKIIYSGTNLTTKELLALKNIFKQSSHPLSKSINTYLWQNGDEELSISFFKEVNGQGLEGTINNFNLKVGSASFLNHLANSNLTYDTATHVHVMVDDVYKGKFSIGNNYRDGIGEMVQRFQQHRFSLKVLSGDNNSEEINLKNIFGENAQILFSQSPQQKFDFVEQLQLQNKNVLMLGDGLNDAGALMQSNVGIAVSDNTAQFSPASDAILDGNNVSKLYQFIGYAKTSKKIITVTFFLSILYNIIGLSFAVQGLLSPMIAAILMPASSISVVALVTLLTNFSATYFSLNTKTDKSHIPF